MKWLCYWAVFMVVTHMGGITTVDAQSAAGIPLQKQLTSRGIPSGRQLTQAMTDWWYDCYSGGAHKIGIAAQLPTNSTGLSVSSMSGGSSSSSSSSGGVSSSALSISSAGEIETLPAGAVLKTPPKARRQPSSGLLAALRRLDRAQGPATANDAEDSDSVVAEAAAATMPDGTVGPASSISAGYGLVKPASICPLDPPFRPVGPSKTTCRLFINSRDGDTYLCTAWFMSDKHVVTAGHCVYDSTMPGKYNVKDTNPGYMCCGFNAEGNCIRGRKWRLLKWVTTQGWVRGEYESNDGAMLEVAPWDPNYVVPGVPQAIATFYPQQVPQHFAWMDGYPFNSKDDLGCKAVNPKMRYTTRAKARPAGLPMDAPGTGGITVQYAVGGCVGESGGRVLFGRANGTAYGIQTWGWVECNNGRGVTGVTQITLTKERCGVCLPCLQQALIAAG